MATQLPLPGKMYVEDDQRRVNTVIEIELDRRLENTDDINVPLLRTDPNWQLVVGNRIILTSPNGSKFALAVQDDGVLFASPL